MPWHTIMFDVTVLDHFSAAGTLQALRMKRTAVKCNKPAIDQWSFAGSAGKTVGVPVCAQRLQTIAVNWLMAAFAMLAQGLRSCDCYSLDIIGIETGMFDK